ncbi:MAG: peptidylprolyl isomerase [Rubrimonas sp.]|uniref:peptidylprolyl isomerase n=1 Tax=Rubrimonas sp. TaxID=2036015 RepID=UPI002FDDD6F3
MLTRRTAVLIAALLPFLSQEAAAVDIKDPENTLLLELKSGVVTIELLPDVAPKHVERIKTLAREGAYDGVAFHRVIPGFMAQTGDVEHGNTKTGYNARRAGTGGSKYGDLPAEFSKVPFERGTVGMARSQNPNSANSQFFIMFEEGSFLNGQYTVFGQVIDGMQHVDNIKMGSRANNGAVEGDPDAILSLKVAADQ